MIFYFKKTRIPFLTGMTQIQTKKITTKMKINKKKLQKNTKIYHQWLCICRKI
jgi:hypothetical protein